MQAIEVSVRQAVGTPLWFLLREAARTGGCCTLTLHFARSRMTRQVRLHGRQARQVLAGAWE
ncbi:MAG: hypothetical protein HUU35_11345 [Armatimonadetes bacterium]|nr:hypothetical protein [Armatimonadota bacterium]